MEEEKKEEKVEEKKDSIDNNDKVKKKEKKTKKEKGDKKEPIDKKKKILGICLAVFIVLFLTIFFFCFRDTSNKYKDNEQLDKEFTITSIEPKTSGNYVKNNETFVVKTSAANEEIVRQHLYVEPAVNYDIKKVNSKEFEVSLKDVPSDTLVNLSLVKNEVKNYSWAFQTTKYLKVLSVSPTNGSASVDTATGISVMLSYPDVENFEEHFEISPKVEGKFVHNSTVWKFIPNKDLKDKETYTITITSGLKTGDVELKENFTSSFSTYNRPVNNGTQDEIEGKKANHSYISVDHINTFTPSEKVTFKMYYTPNPVNKIKMYKMNSYNDFMKFLNDEKNYKAKDLGTQKYTRNTENHTYALDNSFDEGYYVEEVYLKNGELYATIPVQINKTSAFLIASNFDVLVWVGSGNKLLSNVNVSYNGKDYKTDNNGIAKIKNYNDDKSSIKYVTVGDKNQPLVIGVFTDNYIDYPNGYVYTDRPLYKNTDTISIWGYIPIKFFEEMNIGFKKEDLVLLANEENIPITISNDGTFVAKYKLDNYADTGYFPIEVKYKNTTIAIRDVEVKNYTKQNYEYDVIYDKNYVKAGEKFNFTVKVRHVTGVSVQNKKLTVNCDGKNYSGVTNAKGEVSFTIPTKKYNYNSEDDSASSDYLFDNHYISIKTGDSDYNENDFGIDIFTINFLVSDREYNYDSKTKEATLKINTLGLNNKNVTTIDWGDLGDLLTNGKYSGEATVFLNENYTKRVFSHERYNEYTDTKEKVYNYEDIYATEVDKTVVSVKDGVLKYKVNYDLKESTEEDLYSYSLIIVVKDKDGNKYHMYYSLYDYSFFDDYYSKYGYMSSYYSGFYSDDYDYYRYYFTESKKQNYSVNDQINLLLNSFDNSSIGNGKVLRVSLKDSIVESKVFNTEDNLNATFNKSDIPGLTYAGALFLDGKFYRIPAQYYDYNEQDSKLSIDISTDKNSYKPQDEVTVKFKVKDKDGSNVKARISVSVVDKAVFNIVGDTTNILDTIYQDRSLKTYLFSTYRDFSLGQTGGGMGDANGEPRKKFGDTIYFEEVETDSNGEAELKFKLNDSVTSFVITAHAANYDGYVGDNKKEIVSTLPLAISVIEPKGLKTSDETVISANSIGNVKGNVKYTFELKETKKKIEKTAKMGETVFANFGKLKEGTYNVIIKATCGKESDAIEFPFTVKTTQQEIAVKTTTKVNELKEIKPLKNPIILEFYKDGFSKYMKYLDIMLETNQDRLDTRVAYYKAIELENKYYGYDSSIVINDMSKFNNKGVLRYLKKEADSLVVTALVNYYYPSIYSLESSTFYNAINNTTDANVALNNLLVLASMKEPVLDQLNYIKTSIDKTEPSSVLKLALAYAFIGDYNDAKELYNKYKDSKDVDGYVAILSTFVDKENAEQLIDDLYAKNYADRFVFFAMMSYFDNNETDLSKESTINVSYNDKNETFTLKLLSMKKLVINSKDLEALSITSNDDKDMINYYYQSGISEIDKKNIKNNIKLSISSDGLNVGKTASLKLDISNIKGISGNLKVFLPNSLRYSGDIKGSGAYLSSNKGEYLVIYISEKHSNTISIPVYITYPGKYKVEEVILKDKDKYYISNSIDINIK